MIARHRILLVVVASTLTGWLVGCTEAPSSGPLIEYRGSGGLTGLEDRLVIKQSGQSILIRKSGRFEFIPDRDALNRLQALFEQAGFSQIRGEGVPLHRGADLFEYTVLIRRLRFGERTAILAAILAAMGLARNRRRQRLMAPTGSGRGFSWVGDALRVGPPGWRPGRTGPLRGGWMGRGPAGPAFPFGTLVVNLSGSFLLGVLGVVTLERSLLPGEWRISLGIGLLGAYTTFSTWEYETFRLLEAGQWAAGLVNLLGSAVAGFGALALGVVVGRTL